MYLFGPDLGGLNATPNEIADLEQALSEYDDRTDSELAVWIANMDDDQFAQLEQEYLAEEGGPEAVMAWRTRPISSTALRSQIDREDARLAKDSAEQTQTHSPGSTSLSSALPAPCSAEVPWSFLLRCGAADGGELARRDV